jgi:hypothetical protein
MEDRHGPLIVPPFGHAGGRLIPAAMWWIRRPLARLVLHVTLMSHGVSDMSQRSTRTKRRNTGTRKATRASERVSQEMPTLERVPDEMPERGGRTVSKPRRGESGQDGMAHQRPPPDC